MSSTADKVIKFSESFIIACGQVALVWILIIGIRVLSGDEPMFWSDPHDLAIWMVTIGGIGSFFFLLKMVASLYGLITAASHCGKAIAISTTPKP